MKRFLSAIIIAVVANLSTNAANAQPMCGRTQDQQQRLCSITNDQWDGSRSTIIWFEKSAVTVNGVKTWQALPIELKQEVNPMSVNPISHEIRFNFNIKIKNEDDGQE